MVRGIFEKVSLHDFGERFVAGHLRKIGSAQTDIGADGPEIEILNSGQTHIKSSVNPFLPLRHLFVPKMT